MFGFSLLIGWGPGLVGVVERPGGGGRQVLGRVRAVALVVCGVLGGVD